MFLNNNNLSGNFTVAIPLDLPTSCHIRDYWLPGFDRSSCSSLTHLISSLFWFIVQKIKASTKLGSMGQIVPMNNSCYSRPQKQFLSVCLALQHWILKWDDLLECYEHWYEWIWRDLFKIQNIQTRNLLQKNLCSWLMRVCWIIWFLSMFHQLVKFL